MILLGDCIERLKELESESIDCVIVDPPYGTTACKWDIVIPFEPMWTELKRITKAHAAICIFGSEPFSSVLRSSNMAKYKYDWYWHKMFGSNFVQAKRMPLKTVECVSIFSFGERLPQYFPQLIPREKPITYSKSKTGDAIPLRGKARENFSPKTLTHKQPVTLLNYSLREGRGHHPTQKPVSLLEYLIKTYTREGETVLDFTMGSGSTGVAAFNTGRKFIGIEMSEEYCEIARKRIEHANGESA